MKFFLKKRVMADIIYTKPSLRDVAAMQALVRPEIESGIILERSNDEVATNIRSYTAAFDNQTLVGFNALHIHTTRLAEVRSLIVAPQYRSKGVGRGLIAAALKEAEHLGLAEVLVLTYHKEFFETLGFIEISKESLPEHKIWADCIKCKHFPVCNEVSLIKTI
jgi:amino-acid N-acetyltransferase